MTWFLNNISTILVCMVLVGVVTSIIIDMVSNKRRGKSSCGCSCANCPGSDICRGGAVKPKME